MRDLRDSLNLHPARVRTTSRCTQFPNNKSPNLEHVETGVHLVAVSAHAHVALYALGTFLPASSAVLFTLEPGNLHRTIRMSHWQTPQVMSLAHRE